MKVEIKRDGLILRGDLEVPDQDHYDLVILMHGFTGNRNNDLFMMISHLLLENKIASLRFDFNGHGQSDGLLEDMTVFNEMSDAKAILDYALSLKQVCHIYLLGHSQGGVVASMLAGYYPDFFEKLILMAPASSLKDDALKGVCMDATYDPAHIPEKVVVKGQNIGGFYFRIAQQLPIYETAKNFKKEVLLIHGRNDTIVDCQASQHYHEIYQKSTLVLIDGADHSFHSPYTHIAAKKVVAFIKE